MVSIRLSICPSVCPSMGGGVALTQPIRGHSTVLSSKCGQCRVYSRGKRLYTDLLYRDRLVIKVQCGVWITALLIRRNTSGMTRRWIRSDWWKQCGSAETTCISSCCRRQSYVDDTTSSQCTIASSSCATFASETGACSSISCSVSDRFATNPPPRTWQQCHDAT